MKRFLIFVVLVLTAVFSFSLLAQDYGSSRKGFNISIPEKIQGPLGDPLPEGMYTVGVGGDFSTIDSAFNKLSVDGIAGPVTLEFIDNLYTAPTDDYGFLLNGPIPGADENNRVTIKPAINKNVTIEGSGRNTVTFLNTSFVTVDAVSLTGSTTLTFHTYYNSQFAWNDCIVFLENSDHNVVQNITIIDEDYERISVGIEFMTINSPPFECPDSNLIFNNFIKKAGWGIYVEGSYGTPRGEGNIIRENYIGSETDSLIGWGIQLVYCQNTLVENNIIQNLKYTIISNDIINVGINSYWGSGDTIRNNIVHNVKSDSGYTSTGILLSGGSGESGNNNIIYNNMVYDIQSSSAQFNSRVTGIQMWRQDRPKVYYNTVYLSGTGSNQAGSAALYAYSSCTNVEVKNNIFVNTRDESSHCASAIYDYTTANLTSDYNDLYYDNLNPNNCMVRIGSTNYNTLAEWQAAGGDLNSVTEMPNFIGPDLHIDETIPTNIESHAVSIAGIETDIDGDFRNGTTPDIGSDEFNGTAIGDTIYVPQEYSSIQEGIDAAQSGSIVLVDEGTYIENINFRGKAITVASRFFVDGDTSHIRNTVIDGSQPTDPDSASVVSFKSGEDTTSVLCGFTITGGTGTLKFIYASERSGGGIFAFYSGAKIINNIIDQNAINHSSDALGGGISLYSQGAYNFIIENNVISNNSVNSTYNEYYTLGGGIYTATQGYCRINNNKIINNSVTAPSGYGGGIEPAGAENDNYWIINNYISGNLVDANLGGAGAIDIYLHTLTVENNVIVSNTAPNAGGIYIDFTGQSHPLISTRGYPSDPDERTLSIPVLLNNTIANNTALSAGGGVVSVGVATQIINCILWGNSASSGPQIYGTADVQYSDVEGGYTGTGNLDIDPLFDPNSEYFVLLPGSQCIDGGNPDPMYNDVEDPMNPGNPWYPAQGTMRNDIGHCGGPASLWQCWDWPMPVELTSFSATANDKEVILNWSTATETNNQGFEIERSRDNLSFEKIGFVPGFGTSTEPKNYSYSDHPDNTGTYYYRLKQLDYDGSYSYTNIVEVEWRTLNSYLLEQNYPNPFNPNTKIKYSVPQTSQVLIKVFDVLGKEIETLVNEEKPRGLYELTWNATNLPSGIYFYRLKAGNFTQIKKMLLLK